MHYLSWLWYNSRGIRWNTALQIVAGIGQVVLGLLMVWLSKLFIDETIREGSADDVLWMVCWLVMTIVGGVILRQVVYWLSTSASVRQTNILQLLNMVPGVIHATASIDRLKEIDTAAPASSHPPFCCRGVM